MPSMTLDSATVVRVLALCAVLAGVETLHGIARTVLLAPRVGKALAIRLSAASGSLLALLVCLLLVPGIGLQTFAQHLLLGLMLAGFMATFDVALGRLLLRLPWNRVLRDFDPRSGNYLSFGLAFLVCAPALAGVLRGGLRMPA